LYGNINRISLNFIKIGLRTRFMVACTAI